MFIISGLFLGVGVTAYFDKHRLADIGRRKRGHRKMKKNSPFYRRCFEVVSKSPLFINHDKKMIQDALLPFYRETWMKNFPAISSIKTFHRFYIIIAGRLKVFQVNPITGREQILFILGPGDAFDIICLLDGKEHVVNTMAMDDLEVLFASVDEVRSWIGRPAEFNRTFLPYLGKQIREIEELASDLSLYDTGTRLLKLILSHVHPDHSRGKLKLINYFSHEETGRSGNQTYAFRGSTFACYISEYT